MPDGAVDAWRDAAGFVGRDVDIAWDAHVMTVPALGLRGEEWAFAQLGLVLLIVIAGLGEPEWSAAASFLRWVIGISAAAAGWVLFIGIVGLGRFAHAVPAAL